MKEALEMTGEDVGKAQVPHLVCDARLQEAINKQKERMKQSVSNDYHWSVARLLEDADEDADKTEEYESEIEFSESDDEESDGNLIV
jgi:hypothetical protein